MGILDVLSERSLMFSFEISRGIQVIARLLHLALVLSHEVFDLVTVVGLRLVDLLNLLLRVGKNGTSLVLVASTSTQRAFVRIPQAVGIALINSDSPGATHLLHVQCCRSLLLELSLSHSFSIHLLLLLFLLLERLDVGLARGIFPSYLVQIILLYKALEVVTLEPSLLLGMHYLDWFRLFLFMLTVAEVSARRGRVAKLVQI